MEGRRGRDGHLDPLQAPLLRVLGSNGCLEGMATQGQGAGLSGAGAGSVGINLSRTVPMDHNRKRVIGHIPDTHAIPIEF